jgi:hypothetical protein
MQVDLQKGTILRDLGSGLILRRATNADSEALTAFNARIHGNFEKGEPDDRVGIWTRDLMDRPHPTFQPGDFTIVEDTAAGEIISSLNLISQTWTYEDISFGVGRPELVGTHPNYRNRGLIRAQFEVIHQWSSERGEKVQAITGIPYYYRIYGYEMSLELGGGRMGYKPLIPKLPEGKVEPYRVRPAVEEDLAFIHELYEKSSQRSLVSCVWDESLWRYELNGKSPKNVNRLELRIIETRNGDPLGFLTHPPYNWGPSMVATGYELKSGVSYAAVTPSIIRYLQTTGEAYFARDKGKDEFGAYGFWLGSEHPVYEVIPERLPRVRKPYAWYMRVPDLPGFLHHITPVLERRLARSPLDGHSGEIKITFYRSGLKLTLESGRLVGIEAWEPAPVGHAGDVAFPELTFLQLLFGYRSLDELKYAFADCWTEGDEPAAVLNALFPKKASNVMGIT